MKTYLLPLTALALLVGAPATARDFVVEHSDLNLATAEGQKALDKRINSAAREYCNVGALKTGTRIRSSSASACYADARSAARQQMATLITQTQKGG